MMQLSMRTCLALLWAVSVWLPAESVSTSIPETSGVYSTAEPDRTTKLLITPPVSHDETETQPTSLEQTTKPAEVSVATAVAHVSAAAETEGAVVTYRSDSTADSVVMTTEAVITNSSGPGVLHSSTAATTAAGEARSPHITTVPHTEKPAQDEFRQPSSAASANITATAPTSASTVAVTSPQPTSPTEPRGAPSVFSTISPADTTQTPGFIQDLSSPSASTSTMMVNHTSEAAFVSEHTSPAKINETSAPGTETSSATQAIVVRRTDTSTSQFKETTGLSSTATPPTSTTDSSTNTTDTISTISTTPVGILVPRVPKKLPIPTRKSTTTEPPKVSNTTPSTETQPCSTRGLVKQCLIIIASLAVLATIFMVSTIILCTKLSARKYKVRKPPPATEMMCISALLPERNHVYERQRNPVTNGVLVIHSLGDSDEDGGDNLTLSSFLPENERYV